MDPLTHILLGASVGHVAFGKKLGPATGAVAGGLAAFVPDADVFIRSAQDPLLAIEYHRHFTHSVFFAPVGAAIVAALWLFRSRWRTRARWLPLWACCFAAYLSHAFLDSATTYGTQLLWPFTNHRFGWDIVSVIDPAVTLALLIGLGVGLAARRSRATAIGLTAAIVYLGFGALQHARAVAAQRSLAESRGHRIERLEVMPTMANNLVWRALYVHDGRIYADRIRVGWFSAPTVRVGWSLPLVTAQDLTPAERGRNQQRSFERFAWFSENWVGRSPADPTLLGDMRYSLSAEAFDPIWGIRFTPPDAPTEVRWVNRSRDRQVDPRQLWTEISGGDRRFEPLP